jgi:xanthosine utilization system XapX-like protein
MNSIVAGLVSGVIVGPVATLFLVLRRKSFLVEFLKPEVDQDPTLANLGERGLLGLLAGGMVGGALGFGLLAGWVYSQVEDRSDTPANIYLVMAIGIAVVLSILAILTRKEGLAAEKIAANFIFALGFGLLGPWLAG